MTKRKPVRKRKSPPRRVPRGRTQAKLTGRWVYARVRRNRAGVIEILL